MSVAHGSELSSTHHDYTRGAEATLTAIALGYSLLRRMRALDTANALDCDYMLAVYTNQRSQAGIDRGVVDFLGGGIELRDDLQR